MRRVSVFRVFVALLASLLTASMVTGVTPVNAQDDLTCNGLAATIVGTAGDDVLQGTFQNDVIVGLGGNDTINGASGEDTICGGDGDDVINGQSQDDWLSGGNGNDVINGADGADTINGDAGADTLAGDSQNDVINGGDDDDDINGGSGDDTLDGGNGFDTVDGLWGIDTCDDAETALNCETETNNGEPDNPDGGSDPEPFMCNGLQATIIGTDGDDTLQGTFQNDVIVGLGGNDTINGASGEDTICGGDGDDVINGQSQSDWIDAGPGADTVTGADGDDTILGGDGNDNLDGQSGQDTINGGAGNDQIFGRSGNDTIDGGPGDDVIDAGSQNDVVQGGNGNDDINGGPGDDALDGGNGTDTVNGLWDTDTCDDAETALNCETQTNNGEPDDPDLTVVVTSPQAGTVIASDSVVVEFESPDPTAPAVLLVGDQIVGLAESGASIEWTIVGQVDGPVDLVVFVSVDSELVESEPVSVLLDRGVTAPDLASVELSGPPEGSMLFDEAQFLIDGSDGREVQLQAGSVTIGTFDSSGVAVIDTTLLDDGFVTFTAIEVANQIRSESVVYLVGNSLDTDGDGIRDVDDDYDGDGLTLAQEQQLGTSWASADSDADNLSDSEEVSLGLDPLVADGDGDELLDGSEIAGSFDPSDPDTNDDGVNDGIDAFTAPPVTSAGISVTVTGTGNHPGALTIERREESRFDGEEALSPSFDLTLDEGELETAELVVGYDVAVVPADGSPAVFYWVPVPGVWVPAQLPDDQVVDPIAGTVTATVDHFSIYSVRDVNAWARRLETNSCAGGTQYQVTTFTGAAFANRRDIESVAIAGSNTWVGTVSDYNSESQQSAALFRVRSNDVVDPVSVVRAAPPIGISTPTRIMNLLGLNNGSVILTGNSTPDVSSFAAQYNASGSGDGIWAIDGLPVQNMAAAVNADGDLAYVTAAPLTERINGTLVLVGGSGMELEQADRVDPSNWLSLTAGNGFTTNLNQTVNGFAPNGQVRRIGLNYNPTAGVAPLGSEWVFGAASEAVKRRDALWRTTGTDSAVELTLLPTGAPVVDVATSSNRIAVLRGVLGQDTQTVSVLTNSGTIIQTIPVPRSNRTQAQLFDSADAPYLAVTFEGLNGQTIVQFLNLITNRTTAAIQLGFTPTGPVGIDYLNGQIAIAAEAAETNDTIVIRLDDATTAFATVNLSQIDTDTDGDGVPDCVETGGWTANGQTLTSNPDNPDTDQDGLTDGDETLVLTAEDMSQLPNVNLPADYFKTTVPGLVDGVALILPYSNPRAIDTDNDGLDDVQESKIKTDAFLTDTDGDGLADSEEIRRGSDPLSRVRDLQAEIEFWRDETARSCGIDHDAWDPSRGLRANDATVQRVYNCYGDLYLDRKDFHWIGFGRYAGWTFYAAFIDLFTGQPAIRTGELGLNALVQLPPLNPLQDASIRVSLKTLEATALSGEDLADGMNFVLLKFLEMQKQIFDDLAWQYYLYNEEGFEAVVELLPALEDRPDELELNLRLWRFFEAGDLVGANRATALREQRDVIQENYGLIENESAATKALMIVSSISAVSPVPGGKPFVGVLRDSFFNGEIPLISDFDDRWFWIETDMVDAFTQNVVAVDPALDPVFRARLADVVDERRLPVLRDLFDYEPTPL